MGIGKSSRGLAVVHSTQTNMVLGSRPNAGHWWRQEGHPILNAHARTKSFQRHPPSPKELGEMEVKCWGKALGPFAEYNVLVFTIDLNAKKEKHIHQLGFDRILKIYNEKGKN